MARSSGAEIFTTLRQQPRTTRTALTNDLGLGKATVSEAVSLLMASGLVQEVGKQQQERGRSQVVLELQAETRLVTGVQFSDDGCRAVLTDLLGNVLATTVRPLPQQSPDDFVDALVDSVEELTAGITAPIVGLGVGVPGLVAPNGREVIASVPYGWGRVPLADIVEGRLGSEHGRSATRELLAADPPVTAIIAGGNQLLIGALEELRAEGLRIGDDISLVSCDAISVTELFEPPIAVVRRDNVEIGRRAAQLLLERLGDESVEPRQVVLPTEFVLRPSCRPVSTSADRR